MTCQRSPSQASIAPKRGLSTVAPMIAAMSPPRSPAARGNSQAVAEPDLDLGLRRALEPEVAEPDRRVRAPPGRVHHEVGGHDLAVADPSADAYLHARDPVAVRGQVQHVQRCADSDAGERADPGAHQVLEQRPAEGDAAHAADGPAQPVAVVDPADVTLHVAERSAVRDQFVSEAGEELLEDLPAAGVQPVRLPALGNALARHRTVGKGVAVDEGDLVEGLGEHPGGEQPRQARAQHDRVLRRPWHDASQSPVVGWGQMVLRGAPRGKGIRLRGVSAPACFPTAGTPRPGDLRRWGTQPPLRALT